MKPVCTSDFLLSSYYLSRLNYRKLPINPDNDVIDVASLTQILHQKIMQQMLLANVHATKQGSAFTNELIC